MKRNIFMLFGLVIMFTSSSFAQDNEVNRLTNIYPTENSTLDGFSIGDSILFNTSFDSICGGFHERIIENDTKNIIYDAFNSVKSDKGEWVLKFYENVVLQKGHTYTLEIEGHKDADSKSEVMGKVYVNYIGNGQNQEDSDDDYEYSNIYYSRFSPEEGTGFYDKNLNNVMIDFTGDVYVDIDRSVIFDEDGNIFNFIHCAPYEILSRWQFTVPDSLLKSCISHVTLHIYAKDKAGRAIKGNRGKGANSYYELIYKCDWGYPDLSVSPSQGIYSKLEKFTFSNEDGIIVNKEDGIIQLKSSNGETVRSFKGDELDYDSDTNSFVYILAEPLEEIDKYTLVVPAGIFSIGKKGNDNRETVINYEIGNKLKSYGVEKINPSDGSEVESLSEIQITFEQIAYPFYFNSERINVTEEGGDSIITYATLKQIDDKNYIIKLDKQVDEPGAYQLNIPQGTFYMGIYASIESPKMTFDYTVLGIPDKAYNVSIMPIPDKDNTLKEVILRYYEFNWVGVVDSEHHLAYDVILTDTLNNEVATGSLSIGVTNNEIRVDGIQPQLPKGKYQLHIPSGILIFNETIYTKDLVYEIDFNPTTTMQKPTYARRDDKTRVYNTQGMLVREGKIDEVLNGLKGIFIINGKKIVLQ